MKKVALLVVLLLFSGCSTVPREVQVPVALPCPPPPDLPPLEYPLEALRSGSSSAETVRAFALIIEMQKTRIDSFEKILDGYRPKKGGP